MLNVIKKKVDAIKSCLAVARERLATSRQYGRKSKRPSSTFSKLLRSALIATAFTGAAPTAWAQSSLPTFQCDGYPYQVLSGRLHRLDPITLTYTPLGSTTSPNINGIGFNVEDNYAYGMAGGNNGDVYRLGFDGERELVSTGNGGSIWYTAAMDRSGNLYSLRRSDRKQLVKIDISASEAAGTTVFTYVTFTGSVTPPASGDLTWAINGGVEYIMYVKGSTAYYFNLSTNVITTKAVTMPAGTTTVSFGAMWSDYSNRLWGFNNATGQIFEILDAFAPAPEMVVVANTNPNGSNDGFSCSEENFPNLPPLAFDDDYVTPLDTPVTSNVIQNNGNGADEDPEGLGLTVTVLPIAGTGPSNGSVTFSPNGDFTYTPTTGFFGTDTFDYTVEDASGLTATATVTILIEKAEMSLTKTASNDTDVNLGDVITYTYTVENTGNVVLDDVNVTDVHTGSGTLSAITPASVSLAAGASQDFTATYTVTEADIIAGGSIDNTATGQATPESGTITEPTADESIALTAPTPEATFSKLASPDADLDVGDIVTYTYTANNTGNVTLDNVSVTDVHSGSGTLSAITPASATIAPGTDQIFTATYVVTQDDVDAGVDIENTATLSAIPAQGTLADIDAEESVGVIYVPSADLVTVKTLASGNSNPRIGDVVSFDITVTNNGPDNTTNVALTDILPSGLIATANNGTVTAGTYNDVSGNWTIASLANGASATLTLEGMIQVSAAGTSITNITTAATSDLPDGTTTGDNLSAGVSVDSATPDSYEQPNECGAFISRGWLTNGARQTDWKNIFGTGDPETDPYLYIPLTRLPSGKIVGYFGTPDQDVSGFIPANPGSDLSSTNAASANHQSEYHVVAYRLEGIAGTSDTVTISTGGAHEWTAYWVEDSAGTVLNSADFMFTASSGAAHAVGPNVPVTVTYPADGIVYLYVGIFDPTVAHGRPSIRDYTCPEADLVTVKSLASGDATPDLGDTVTFDITVTNNGPSDAINTTLTDLLPAGLTATANNGTVTTGAYDAATGDWTIANLADGATATLTLEGTVDLAAAGTTITNITTAATSDVPDSDTAGDVLEASFEVLEATPDSTLTKTASNDTDVAVGDVITYTYEFTNTGNVTLTNVSVSDVHNGTGTLGAITPATVASIAPGDSATFTADYTVTQADIDAGTAITNTATSAATPAAGTYTPVTADESIAPETPAPDSTLTKTASNDTDVKVGDVITYTYVFSNTGNTTMTDVSVTDVHNGTGTLGAITPATVASIAPGDSATFTADYTVTQADIDAGTAITNTATSAATPAAGTYTPVTADESIAPETPAPDSTLTKTASNDTDVKVGDVITYTYVFSNTGNTTMTDVSVTDVHSGTGTLGAITPATVATVAPGATATFTADYTVTQADIDAGAAITNTATSDATTPGGYTPVTADETVTANSGAPEITFTKSASAPTNLAAGDIVTYTYTAENTGNVTITNVSVSDVHNGSGSLSAISPASIATLNVGQTATFTATYEVTQADIDVGVPITNQATVTGTPSQGTLPPTTADESVTPESFAPSLAFDKRAVDTDFAVVGDVVSYEYDVENTGNVTISGITVTDDKIASVSCPVTTLAPGEAIICTADYTITQDDLNAGLVTNNASADGNPAGGTLTPPTDSETVNGTQTPKFSLEKTAIDTNFAMVGDTLDYEYLVTNTGNIEITGIAISDDKISSVSCPVTTLMPTQSVTCTGTYTVTQADLDAGSVTNIAEATGTPAGGNLAAAGDDETVNGTQSPALEITKTALSTDFTMVGDMLDYEYLVTNTGNTTITAPITVDDDKIAPPLMVQCPSLPAGGLLPNDSLTCTASYSVTQADLDAGFVTNTASATDGNVTSPTDDATVNGTQAPAMSLVKTPVETSFDAVGDIINYDYTVENTGNVLIANLVVTDNLISSITCSVSAIGNGDTNLDPGEVVVCTGLYTVTQADIDNGSVTNIAGATGDPSGGTLIDPSTDATVDADQMPELTLVKTANETSFSQVGDILTYDYTVENTGNVYVSNISVSDDKISTVICDVSAIGNNDANLDPGETVICTASYTVTQADIDAGDVTNNASATGNPAGGTLTDPSTSETVDADQMPAMDVVKSVVDENFQQVGDITTYEYVITNTGNTTITAPITVNDNLIPSISCPALPAGGLLPTASLTCTGSYTVTQADLDSGTVTNLASATDGTITTPQTSETIPADQDPALTIEKAALFTDFTTAGEVVQYEFTVTNSGNLTLTGGVNVVDDKIGTITCVAGNFAPGDVQTCTASYTITQADVDNGSVTNQAYAQNGSIVSPPDDVTVDAVQDPSLTFDKRATSGTFTNAGDVLAYEFDVENTGNVTLTNVSVTDSLTAVSCPLSTLAPTQTMVCTASYTVTQADVDAGEVINNAAIDSTAPDGSSVEEDDTETVESTPNPSLSFEKRALDTVFTNAGDILDYEFDVENDGSVTLSNISISDSLTTVSCPLTSLAPTQTMLCKASYTVTQADVDSGSVTNTASASSDLPDGTAGPTEDDQAVVDADNNPSMRVDKTAVTPDFAAVGDVLDYTYLVENTGNVTISNIVVTDNLIPSLSCPATTLTPTATMTCTGTYTVTQADIDAGSVTNIADVTGDPASGGTLPPVTDDATVGAVQDPSLEIVKTALNTDYNTVGDTVDYEYVVTNNGNVTITNAISVNDNLIPTVNCPSVPSGGLLPGNSLTCTATYVITQADIDAGSVTNTASATDGTTTSPVVDETVNADQMPSLAMTKTASPQVFSAVGDTISYDYVITNTGNITITDPVTVTDNQISSVSCPALPAGGLVPNATLTCTATDVITQADIDAGSLLNTASATDGTTTSPVVDETVQADQMPSMDIVKTATDVNFENPGDITTYQYVVTNTGNTSITASISVNDNLIPSVSCPALPVGGLTPGASLTCTATYTVTQTDLDIGSVTNVATATDGTTTSSPDAETIPADGNPALIMRKSSTDNSYSQVGDVLTYTFEIENAGNLTLTGNTSIVDNKIGTFVCYSGNLAPSQIESCTANYTVTQADIDAGSVTNDAYAENPLSSSPPDSVTINADQAPDITLAKTALTTTFNMVGDTLDYEYLVTNTGNVTLTSGITVSDDRISTVTCPALPAGGLLPNASITCTGTDTITQADIDAGFVTNTASATDGTTTSDPVDETVSGDQTSTLELDKVATSNNFTLVGDVLNYDFIVRNTGNVTITQAISINDDKIGAITCPALPAGGLVPGATHTCSANYTVKQADIDAGEVVNIATASSGGTTSAPDTATISGTQEPALTIAKSTSVTAFTSVGEIISYDYVVTNTGNVTITNAITVSDDKIATVNCPTLPAGGLLPSASLTCSADYAITQADIDAGEVTNIATASDDTTTSEPDNVTVEADITYGLSIVKQAITTDFSMPGDILSYEYDVTNTGNSTVKTPIEVSDDKIATVICPALPAGGLAPSASLTCSADYVVTQADIDAGSVTNIASASSGNLTSPQDEVTVEAVTEPELTITKNATEMVQAYGPLYDVTYVINVENTGNVTLNNFQVSDDLQSALAPATLFNTPSVTVSGISGGVANTAYDGASNINLLSGAPLLNVGESGLITLTARIDTTNGGPAQPNTATGSSAELADTLSNPAAITILDVDGDGSPDNLESCTEDRDGDGIPDCEDYDPTGYFYCEENGQILSGGGISVSGPTGSNASIGLANNINIVQDGSDGYFQFYVTAPGRYVLTPTYPPSGVPSVARPVQNVALDVTSLLPSNPAIIGSSEVGNTGQLDDFSAAANTPFYFEFDIEAGDPSVLMNNIPLRHCGSSELRLAKSVIGEPVTQEDGRQLVTYEFNIENSGQTQVDDIQITDDLGDVYGDANVVINRNEIMAEPVNFAGNENAAYNGVTEITVLDGLGSLAIGENMTVQIEAIVAPETASTFINKATVQGANPLTGNNVAADDTASIELIPAAKVNDLIVRKSANPRTVQIGDPVLYTIDVTNSGIGTISNIDLVDDIPEGFAYIPNSASVTDGFTTVNLEPIVAGRSSLSWSLQTANAAPLDYLSPGETVSVNLRLLAGPNVEFGAHENQAYAENRDTGERSDIATAVVDYIPEPSFDCTPVIGRVYDDVNHNGYPDDGEPGLPAVRLVTVNGDIITTDEYGRYHIPCAIIANSERGSNFLLKTDVRTLPLGYSPTTENPRVVRATRGKFVKMNFGAAHRPKLRVDVFPADFADATGEIDYTSQIRIRQVLEQSPAADRALLVYHADDLESVDIAQAALKRTLKLVKSLSPDQFKDIAMEASWGDAKAFSGYTGYRETEDGHIHEDERRSIGQNFDGPSDPRDRDHVLFFENDNGILERTDYDTFSDSYQGREAGLRGDQGSEALEGDTRRSPNSFGGRRDNGEAESARPGRLLRWVGWGNKTSSYAEGMEIETTSTALDVIKRLNVQANIVSGPTGRTIRAEGYWNYDAFIERAELRIFDADTSTRGVPVQKADFVDGEASLNVNTNMEKRSNNTPERMVYVLRAYHVDGSFDETAPKTLRLGDAEFDLTEEEWAREANTAFGQNSLRVDNIRVRGGSVRVYGRNVPGTTADVMGQTITVDDDGKFISEQILPMGEQTVEIKVAGENGTENRILRTVDVKNKDTFYVAQIEATVGENIAEDASGDRSFEEGRIAFYVRSRLNDRWAVTATADTGEAEIENLFSGLDDKDLGQLLRRLDPERYYPTYGDDSTIEQDAPTSGKFYARLERDDDYVLWGNYQTNFNDTEFARVQRTLYGAKLHWDENGNPTKFGDDRTRLTAFIAEGGSRQGRDELRGTGGSVYYLRNGDIAIGSEILRIETRDSVSGLVIESRRLTYGSDYDMDFIQGRVILNQPLGSATDDGRLFRDGSLSGNETVLVIDYEFTPIFGASDDAAIYGARGSRWFGDHVKLGATYNHDTDGGAESDLYEVDLTLQYAAGTYIKGEYAKTKGLGVQTYQSIDGGFTYNPLDRGGLANNTSASGYAVEAAVDFNEVDGFNLDGNSYAYWRKRQAGFAGYAETTNQTIEQFGGGLNINLSEGLNLTARADASDDQTLGTNSFAEARLDYKANEEITASVGLSYNDNSRGNAGTSLGARIDYEFEDESNVYLFGQVGIEGDNQRTTDRIGVGAEVRLSKKILGGGEISTGEDGLGARASLRYQYEDGDEYYLAYDLPLNAQAQSNLGTFNFGARRRYTDALSVYGEERLQFNDTGVNGVTHAYGVDYKPGNWNFGLSGEVGRIDNLDREAFSGSVGYASDRMRAGFTGEWREDENVDTGDERRTWLLRSTASYLASEELRLQGKLNLAFSDQSRADADLGPQSFNEAEFKEASIAAAYRPIWDDRFNMLAKLVWLEDLSPTSQRFNGETLNYRQKSTIASVDASYDIAPKWTLGGKYAYRAGSVTSNRESLDFTKSEAELGVIRLDYHATHKWDAVLEGRILDIGNGTITRKGGLAGVYRHVNDNAKIGVGVTWGGIEEEYLATISDEDDLGWYLNVIGKF